MTFYIFSSQTYKNMMFCITILFAFLFGSSTAATSFCLECPNEITVNYLVTATNLPSFDQCRTVASRVCVVDLYWDYSSNTTTISIFEIKASVQPQLGEDTVTAYSTLEDIPSNNSLSAQSGFLFMCTSESNCNDKTSIQKLLRSLIIQNQLKEQLHSLIIDISPFDPMTAGCFNFANRTGDCPTTDLRLCDRCRILVERIDLPGQQICSGCPVPTYAPVNKLSHSKVFSVKERQVSTDVVEINCQTNGCNSLYNVNRVLQYSRIIFDMDTYFS